MKRSRRAGWLLGIVALLPLSAGAVVTAQSAAPAAWIERDYRYVVIDQDVRQVLREFGRNLALPVVIGSDVEGRIEGNVQAETAGEFLDRVCRSAGLAWYYLGSTLYVDEASSLTTRVIDVTGIDDAALAQELRELDSGNPLTLELDGQRLALSGPPGWIEQASQRLAALKTPLGPRPGPDSVRIIRGSTSERVERPPAGNDDGNER